VYLLKLALRPWRIAPWSQVFSAMAVGFLLLLAGFLTWMERGLKPVVARLQGEQVITAYLDPSLEPKDEQRVTDEIRTSLAASRRAADVEITLVGARDFVNRLQAHYPELSRELGGLPPSESAAVVPRYVSVTGLLSQASLEGVRKIPGVESAESSSDRHQHIVGAFRALRWVSRLLVVGLCLALLTGLIHLSRMNSYLHRDALALLRLWGAGGATLRTPSLLSGFWVGLAGGAIALFGWIGGGSWLALQLRALSPMLREMPEPGWLVGAALLCAGAMIGVVAGALGSPRGGEGAA
jgi:cell division protein FtsX